MSKFDHKAFVNALTTRPGVYQMYDDAGGLLYVGKAKNLKNRVGKFRYFRIAFSRSVVSSLPMIVFNINFSISLT